MGLGGDEYDAVAVLQPYARTPDCVTEEIFIFVKLNEMVSLIMLNGLAQKFAPRGDAGRVGIRGDQGVCRHDTQYRATGLKCAGRSKGVLMSPVVLTGS